ncbi:SUMO-interacting motif-containing protein 1 [Sphaerodactylus townsendi]|uniref:SUMO-interacting motif-containing protein 1 n=1 Tax=Sphaerodactylus townsendi TaxID=933632 RepID=UPI002025FD33|nr:SUMO-interacting motif-containing protein 1 [Sphaerodactylus townsendi]
MTEGVIHIAGSSSEGDASEGSSWARRRRQLQRKRRRRCLQAASEFIDLTGEDLVEKTAVYHDLGVIDLTQTEETMVSPLHSDGYLSVNLTHWTSASMQPVDSPKFLTILDPERTLDMSLDLGNRKQPSPKDDVMQHACFQGNFGLFPSYDDDSESTSHTTYNSDLGSLGSPLLGSDVSSTSSANGSSEHETLQDPGEDTHSCCLPEGDLNSQLAPPDQRHSPRSPISQYPLNATLLRESEQFMLGTNNPTPDVVKPDNQEPNQQIDIKVWLKTLQYFPGVPVHHPFLHNMLYGKDAKQNKQQRDLNLLFDVDLGGIVSSTVEENFFRGTLDFLMDYVSSQYYPPEKTMQDLVRQILLSSEVQQEILRDAYMLLMKIQALHPAKADTVVWDWDLLRKVMIEQEKKFPGRLLFLKYMLQTLEDDFQTTARNGILHKSIAKKMLSCDLATTALKDEYKPYPPHRGSTPARSGKQSLGKFMELIDWLVAAVVGTRFSQHRDLHESGCLSETTVDKNNISIPELQLAETTQVEDVSPQFQSQSEVMLLQRMLAIAVEVDKSPNCSANKIADVVFSSVLNIPKRCQRDAFLSSMECHLLRCKVLELIFNHSCKKATDLPLSMEKVLFFLTNLSLQLKHQDNEATWQRWDEMLHHLNLLVLSYHRIILGHLRSSICDRINLIIKAAKPKLQSHDSLTISDADYSIKSFQKQLLQILGQPLPSPLKEKIELLQILLHTTADIYRTFGNIDGPLRSGSSCAINHPV